jgi:5'-3' exonuclease
VKQFVPDSTIFVWDEKPIYKKNIRKDILEGYKGNRSKDSSPHQNNEVIKSILKTMGINSIFPSQLEADDVVAYICREKEGSKVIISVDRDFLQLVCEDCMLYDPIRKKYFDINSFEDETGFKNVEEWYTAKCLTGDKSDNVPGIPKFGAVSVKKYLNDPGYILNESQQNIFKRNADIFCLDKYESLPEEKEYYKEQLEVKIDSCYKSFLNFCKEFSFERILSKKEDWYNLFFMESLYNKLNDISS